MSDLIGNSFGRYHILEQLGEGGMATVYKAYDTRLETDVAVKVIRTENIQPSVLERALKRFEREAKALARLTHPNIVKVTDYGEYEDKPYLVMEYLPGGTLKQKMGKPVPWQEAVQILIPIAEALGFAHSQNMVHRDVKPSNILLTERGQPMLTDFGIAKILDLEETQDLTGTSAAIGTPEYMAPEQVTAKTVDHRADIYSLGIVLYEMVTGRKPFIADTPMAVLIKHTTAPLPRPKDFVSNIPDKVEKILLKSLAKQPENRYQDMDEFIDAMKGLQSGKAVIQPVVKPVSRRKPEETIAAKESNQPALAKEEQKPVSRGLSFRRGYIWLGGLGFVITILTLVFGLNRLLPRTPPTPQATNTTLPTMIPDTPPEPVRENVLRVNIGSYPDVIDPQKSSFLNEIAHLNKVYMGLTTFNEKLETIPGAAESWSFNDNATRLVFKLKPNLVYSDGSVLNAKRFEFAFQRNIDPTIAGEYAVITDNIIGAPEWRTADTTATGYDPEIYKAALGIKASHADGTGCTGYEDTDCDTLTLTFSAPALYFPSIAGMWVGYPAKQENIEEGGDIWWASTKFQVGNGPFIWKSLEPFVKSVFVPNPKFAGTGIPTYNLEYSYVTDSAVAFESYKDNEFDIIVPLPEDLPTIEADSDLVAQHVTHTGSCSIHIKFSLNPTWNNINNPFTDKKVREAFALAFDAEGWARDVDRNFSVATWTWIPPGYPGYDPDTPLRHDVEAARAALAASSYGGPDTLNALNLKLTFSDTTRNRERYEWLVANYKANLGVDIALDPVEATTITALQSKPNTYPLLVRTGWCADYPDPQNWLSVYWGSDTIYAQRQGYNNPEFDKLVKEADVTIDLSKRMELYSQAQQIMLADIPAAFGYNTLNHYLVKPWVKGFKITPQDFAYPGDQVPWTITIDTMTP